MSAPPSALPRIPRGAYRSGLGACLLLTGLWSCGGGSGSAGAGASGALGETPQGRLFLQDAHQGGRSTRLRLLEVTRGRLVDVHDVDETGAVSAQPVLEDLVIDENIQTDAGRYRLQTNPITLETRLVIRRTRGAPDQGNGTFESLLLSATRNLPPILPRNDDGSSPTPFTVVPRNACLMLRFDDVLDDSAQAAAQLVQTVRVLEGYVPDVRPRITRIVFDSNHGALVDDRFHSTRVLIDLTVTESELSELAFPASLNSSGLDPREADRSDPNVSIRIPTLVDPTQGFFLLRSLGGVPLDAGASLPADLGGSSREVVRAFRSGGPGDPNNGFLLDTGPPELVGSWGITIDAAAPDPDSAAGTDLVVDLTFTSICRSRLQAGDTIESGTRLLEVRAGSKAPVRGSVAGVRVRAADGVGITDPDELLGRGRFFSTLDPDLGVPDACWLTFTPEPADGPDSGVSTGTQLRVSFTESMDPASVSALETVIVQRGSSNTGAIVAEDVVVARMVPSADQKSFFFVPRFPLAHRDGVPDSYHVRLGDVTDLAGNSLRVSLAPVDFTLSADQPEETNGGVTFRFSSLDEVSSPVPILIAQNENDFRGQFLLDTGAGILRGRAPVFSSSPADRGSPIPGIMIPFLPGVQTPLSPFGSKLQFLWRYADFGFLPFDETRYNVDVTGLAWAPVGGGVVRDRFPEFEIRLAHSKFIPDEEVNQARTPRYSNSGLADGPFNQNILNDPLSPQKIVHPRLLGYDINRLDRFRASSGTLMMPYPLNRNRTGPLVTYTWRDNAVLARGGGGGNGVPLDIEIGPPINLFPTGTLKVWRNGNVPSVVLPLLVEIRCFPTAQGLGLNALDISIALNTSRQPSFRAFSTGGVDAEGLSQDVDPASEPNPRGGFNPNSNPPGQRTGAGADNALYIGQLDTVVRVSRVHSVWVDTRFLDPEYSSPEVLPDPADQPPGTAVLVDFRGATGFELPLFKEELPYVAENLDPYGDLISDISEVAEPAFLGGSKAWTADLADLAGARYFQVRITFVNNIEALTRPELSALGVAFRAR